MTWTGVSVRRVVIAGSSVIFVAFLLTATYSLLIGVGWKTESVSVAGWGTVHDMVVDSQGKAHMASLGVPGGSLGYIEETDDGWSITKLYELGDSYYDYFDVSIAVDSKDRPYVCTGKFVQVWEDVFDPRLVIAKNDGNVWIVQDIPVEYCPTSYIVATDSQDTPFILWTGRNLHEQCYVGLLSTDSNGWNNVDVVGPYLGEEANLKSFIIDKNDNMHAIMLNSNHTSSKFHLERLSGVDGEWTNETITEGDRSLFTVAASSIDENGRNHVILSEWDSTDSSYWLAYMRDVSGIWEKTRVAYAGDTDFCMSDGVSIATDENGGVHILYYARSVESQNHTVRYAICESGQWTYSILDEGAPMSFTSVQVAVCTPDDVRLSYFVDDWTRPAKPTPVLTVRSYHDLGEVISPALDSGVLGGALSVVPVTIGALIYLRYKKSQTQKASATDGDAQDDPADARRSLVRDQLDSSFWARMLR